MPGRTGDEIRTLVTVGPLFIGFSCTSDRHPACFEDVEDPWNESDVTVFRA
jgi:hypothetical protein